MTAKSTRKNMKSRPAATAQADARSSAPKKPAAKAASAKPVASPTKKPAVARNVSPEYYFFLVDGRPLKNLMELADAMEEMTEEAFRHHVTDTKNDFAKWVHDVFGDEELSIKLGQSKTKHHHQLVILKHLVRRLLP